MLRTITILGSLMLVAGSASAELIGGETVDVADFIYDDATGEMSIAVWQDQVEAGFTIEVFDPAVLSAVVPELVNFPKFMGVQDAWLYQKFAGKMQYYDSFLLNGGAPITAGSEFVIAYLPIGLSLDEFGQVEYGCSVESQITQITPEPASLALLSLAGIMLLRGKR